MSQYKIHIFISTIVIMLLLGLIITGSGLFIEYCDPTISNNFTVFGSLGEDTSIFDLLSINDKGDLFHSLVIVTISGISLLLATIPVAMIWGTTLFVLKEK